METAVVSLICIALIVFGGMTMSQGFLTSVDTTSTSLEEISNRSEDIMRTEQAPTQATTAIGGLYLDVRLTNTGQTKLASFSKWDFIVQYYDDFGNYYVKWLPYTTGALGDNEWQETGIFLNGLPEAFEPNILNPGEEIRLRAQLNPAVGLDTTNLVTISTPNGIPVSISLTR
ncbi:MAG: hypothetical protein V1691_03720 [Chloroflexota bacterium]